MKNKLSIAALLAGGMMVATAGSAQAADLGGDCCADLEERVATLEATTARKGNRKVSLTISGQVNQALMIWDDGVDSDAYIGSNTNSASRFRFKGNANINSDWSAGYYMEIEVATARTSSFTQANDDAGASFSIRQSNIYVKSKTLGKLSWGQLSSATDDLAFYGNIGAPGAAYQPDAYSGGGLLVRRSSNGTTAGALSSFNIGYDNPRINGVRYDTPTIGGFVLSASWGEDDYYDAALRYAGTWGDFKVKAGIGYSVNDDNDTGVPVTITTEDIIITAGISHTPTGLFLSGGFIETSYDGLTTRQDGTGYHINAGIKQRWNSLGHTTIFGAYQVDEDDAALTAGTSSEMERISFGIQQNIDAAALELYAVYDHYEVELSTDTAYEDIDVVTIGGRIKF